MFENFEMKKFVFKDRDAIIISPNCKSNGRMLFKTEYLEEFTKFDTAMLERGYHLIHINHSTRWASDEENDIMADFVRYCAKQLDVEKKCILEGLSCGGLQAAKLAETYPELVDVIYLDNPVLNILSMVGLGECKHEAVSKFWREIVTTYQVNRSTIINFRKSPIDNMQPLIDNDIPIIMIHGNADDVVIYEENGRVLENFYKENGGRIKVITKSMCGHHPHGLDDPSVIIEFVENKSSMQRTV